MAKNVTESVEYCGRYAMVSRVGKCDDLQSSSEPHQHLVRRGPACPPSVGCQPSQGRRAETVSELFLRRKSCYGGEHENQKPPHPALSRRERVKSFRAVMSPLSLWERESVRVPDRIVARFSWLVDF